MAVILKNNAFGFLATSISASDTSIILTTGTGANFPTLGAGDYFYTTIAPTSGAAEIVKCTARSGDTLTVIRAQESTSALSFAGGSRVELRVTAQSVLDAVADRVVLAVVAVGTGSQTVFAVSDKPTAVYINGVYQNQSTYTFAAGNVTFSQAPPLTSGIEFLI